MQYAKQKLSFVSGTCMQPSFLVSALIPLGHVVCIALTLSKRTMCLNAHLKMTCLCCTSWKIKLRWNQASNYQLNNWTTRVIIISIDNYPVHSSVVKLFDIRLSIILHACHCAAMTAVLDWSHTIMRSAISICCWSFDVESYACSRMYIPSQLVKLLPHPLLKACVPQ